MKLIYTLIMLLGFASVANADEGLYLEGGLSVHLTKYDTPEVDLDNPIANIGMG